MDGRQRYLALQEIVDTAIECGGVVFGGYVRDFILHEHAATQFYMKHTADEYSDPSISPETIDRLLIPSDIDVRFETKMQYRQFRGILKQKLYQTTVSGLDNIYIEGPSIHHIKLRAQLTIHPDQVVARLGIRGGMAMEVITPELHRVLESMDINTPPIDIDVLITKKYPTFEKLDFQCNGLVMDKNGISLGSELRNGSPFGNFRTYSRVLDDIRAKRAVMIRFIDKRWEKMAGKGWTMVGDGIEKVHTEECVCTLCLDDISIDCVYKFKCCNAHYHPSCMGRIISQHILGTGKCPHCRADMNTMV